MLRLRDLVAVGLVCTPSLAAAGGLFLPGSGAISTSRAGASVASADDGEALSVNPARLASNRSGTTVTVSAALISYSMQFTRTGTYDAIEADDRPWEGQAYPTVENDVSPPLALGSYQPVPVLAVVSDLGGAVKGLTVAAGVYAPNAYPFRDLQSDYVIGAEGDPNQPPPPTRYDVMYQEAAVILPSIAAAYRITPELDVGARFSFGFAHLKSKVAIWGTPANVTEDQTHDATLTADVKDNLVPVYGFGLSYRPAPAIELGAQWTSSAPIYAKGGATSTTGVNVLVDGNPVRIGPNINSPVCSPGELGTFEEQKICIQLELPMNATVGGRYKILGDKGELRGDIEANVQWERWGKKCDLNATGKFSDPGCTSPGEYRVVTDASAYIGTADDDQDIDLGDSILSHNLKDTFSFRLGGSFHLPLSANTEDGPKVIVRGGLAHDTAAANAGWLRADLDGAARTTLALGGGYSAKKFEVNVGAGLVIEGSPSNDGTCNPTTASEGCTGTQRPTEEREGPDPTFPLSPPNMQQESPFNQGKYDSHYVLFMLGVTAWF